MEKQLTNAPHGHILTNTAVWSPDGKWIVYDTRSDPAGSIFDGTRIEKVHVDTGEVRVLYESQNGAMCGVATWSPTEPKIAFILGPDHPTVDWSYAANRRKGVIVDDAQPGLAIHLDARDLTPPFTPGALRGGSHLHIFSPDGQWISFTYQDQVLEHFTKETAENDVDLRSVGVSIPGRRVSVSSGHPRNHPGEYFSVLVTRATAHPKPGSDQISRAMEEAWVGTNGYIQWDGTRQTRALAFIGQVVGKDGRELSEAFIVDLPDDLTVPSDGPLEGTETRRPVPPRGTAQRRLTYTEDRKYPGLQPPRHWLRSSPDGAHIAVLMKDDNGIVQLWSVSPLGGFSPITHNNLDIASAFTWSADGRSIAHVMDNSVCVTDIESGHTTRLTERSTDAAAPRPEACVFCPDGHQIAYIQRVETAGVWHNQVFVVTIP